MLTALEHGVKGGRWFSLIDKVWSQSTLRAGYSRVAENKGAPGVDRQTIEMFDLKLEANLLQLQQELKAGTYQPKPVRRVWIPKPGTKEKRPLGIPTVRDRVVQAALRAVLEPIFEREFAEHSYGFRPGRGCKDALRRVDALLKSGYRYVVDVDLKSYFDTIPHEPLMARVEAKISDGRILDLIRAYLKQGVMDGLAHWEPHEGSPQGAVISPLLSNIYLDPLDQEMARHGHEMIRYADDFVVLCRSEAEAQEALALVSAWTTANGLTIHPTKTRLVDTDRDSFDFLGYRFEQGQRWPREKSLRKFKDAIRSKTRRANGRSLKVIIEDVNRTTKGWFEYFKHSHHFTFERLDGWIRMRLRSILRKRCGRRGRGRGRDHQRWPNAYFVTCGLFSMDTAYEVVRQSALR